MRCIALLFLLMTSTLFSQEWRNDHFGVQLGLSANFGTHVQRIGIRFQAYSTYSFAQFNIGHQIHFNKGNLADRQNYFSNRSSIGLVLLAGKRSITPQFIFDGLNHQTHYEYGLGYNYLWYFDNAGSSQRSGGFGIHVQEFSLLIENDLFAGSGRDRFRTSYFSVQYHTDLINLSLNSQLWTGETWGTKLRNTPDSLYQVGYKDLSKTLYGKKSHGILSIGIDYLMGYGNRIHTLVGIDHERIRHGLQNKFMHDKPFIPNNWRTPNVNYPMLNKEGLPIHHKGEEDSGMLFYQFGLNRSLTY